MKRIHETFTDEEFELLKKRKGKRSWHDWIMKFGLESKLRTEQEIREELKRIETHRLRYTSDLPEIDSWREALLWVLAQHDTVPEMGVMEA